MSRRDERPPFATLDAPGVNGNPPGAIIRGSPTPIDRDPREAAQVRRPLAAQAKRHLEDAGVASRFDAPAAHDSRPVDPLHRLEHASGPPTAEASRGGLPATISVREVGALIRASLAEMGIAPTAIQGISDRVQVAELVTARDMSEHREAIDDQHDRLVRMERDFQRLADTIRLAEKRAVSAEDQLRDIRELLLPHDAPRDADIVAEVRKRLRWSKDKPLQDVPTSGQIIVLFDFGDPCTEQAVELCVDLATKRCLTWKWVDLRKPATQVDTGVPGVEMDSTLRAVQSGDGPVDASVTPEVSAGSEPARPWRGTGFGRFFGGRAQET